MRPATVVTPGDKLDEAARIGVLASKLQVRVLELTIDALRGRGAPGVTLLARSFEQMQEALDLLEPRCQWEVASLRVASRFDAEGALVARNEASARRGVRLLAVGGPKTLVTNPLWPSDVPFGRVAPVYGQMILMDRSCAILPGPLTAQGGETVWMFTTPEIVRAACELWDATYAVSVEPDRELPRFNPRQVEVARRRARGWTNTRIARDLGISARTVTAELARLPVIVF